MNSVVLSSGRQLLAAVSRSALPLGAPSFSSLHEPAGECADDAAVCLRTNSPYRGLSGSSAAGYQPWAPSPLPHQERLLVEGFPWQGGCFGRVAARLVEGQLEEEGREEQESYQVGSVLKIRRRKMNKHKAQKRRWKMRFLRRKLGKA